MLKLLNRGFIFRICIYLVGFFAIALGGVFTINSAMGVSPMNALPYVISHLTPLSLGFWFTLQFSLFVVIQKIILGKRFSWIQVLQVPASMVFGYFVDLARLLVGDLFIPTYFGQLTLLFIGMFFIATGITMVLSTGFLTLPPEGLVLAFIKVKPKLQFSTVMIRISIVIVGLSVILSMLFLGELVGAREGTIIAALVTGKMVPWVKGMYNPLMSRFNIEGFVS